MFNCESDYLFIYSSIYKLCVVVFFFQPKDILLQFFLKTNRIKVGYVFVANVDSFLKFKLPANNKIDRFISVYF